MVLNLMGDVDVMADELVIKIDKKFGKKVGLVAGAIIILIVAFFMLNKMGAGTERDAIKEVERLATERIKSNSGGNYVTLEDINVRKDSQKEDFYYIEARADYSDANGNETSQNISYQLQFRNGSWEVLLDKHYNVG